jgi:predicted DsbA family dithiol-disulfide isomerase
MSPRWSKLVVYGDLNCPFCFALEERLTARGIEKNVEWQLVEHAPQLPTRQELATEAELEELECELNALVERAPDVVIHAPPFRPNSRRAIEAVAEALRIDHERGDALRRRLFRALWLEGRDIADEAVVAELALAAGLPKPGTTHAAAAADDAKRWTETWRATNWNRIPCMITDAETKLLGLAPVQRLELFLRSGLFSSSTEDHCRSDEAAS